MQSYITQEDLRHEWASILDSYTPAEREYAAWSDAHGLTAPGSVVYDEETGAVHFVLAVVRVAGG